MENKIDTAPVPLILAPAGGRQSFLAALAAGADGIYCGLKTLSARMAAVNFSIEELAPLADLARKNNTRLLITLNSLLKPEETDNAARMVASLVREVRPDALILQDLGFLPLIRQAGFSGEIHLSTLANVSFTGALAMVRERLQVDQVVIPRELNIDEIKLLAAHCPDSLGLEIFIHGALCYGVSGRCYWSSFLGGKSGLRGRCVQPCRRIFSQEGASAKFFSCQDLSMDVLAKVLLDIPQIRGWKIEGRKKGPHYVYYTVTAYRMLRDHGRDPQAKKDAVALLERALGRPGTHYNFLPQRPQNPISTDAHTGSGLLVGRVKTGQGKIFLAPREALLAGDMLRIGYEDEAGYGTIRVGRYVPKHGTFYLNLPPKAGQAADMPVFLVDRMEPALKEKMDNYSRQGTVGSLQSTVDSRQSTVGSLEDTVGSPEDTVGSWQSTVGSPGSAISIPLEKVSGKGVEKQGVSGVIRRKGDKRPPLMEFAVYRKQVNSQGTAPMGYWLSQETVSAAGADRTGRIFWWLPPVIWPDAEEEWAGLVAKATGSGARRFVLNAPWQTTFFDGPEKFELWAGPFCNTANLLAISVLKGLGFSGVVISPELGEKEVLALPGQSPLPLGIVVEGGFPLSISRTLSEKLASETLFLSPKGEGAWARRHGSDIWIYPNWKFDISEKRQVLQEAGYRLFITLDEAVPGGVSLKKRPGVWNWDVGLG